MLIITYIPETLKQLLLFKDDHFLFVMIWSYPTETCIWSRCFGYQVYKKKLKKSETMEAVDPMGVSEMGVKNLPGHLWIS